MSRYVNELNWFYCIIEITKPTVVIKKYQSLPCTFLLPTWGLQSGDAVGACPPPGAQGPLAGGGCLLTCLLFVVKTLHPNLVPLLGVPWGQSDLGCRNVVGV